MLIKIHFAVTLIPYPTKIFPPLLILHPSYMPGIYTEQKKLYYLNHRQNFKYSKQIHEHNKKQSSKANLLLMKFYKQCLYIFLKKMNKKWLGELKCTFFM